MRIGDAASLTRGRGSYMLVPEEDLVLDLADRARNAALEFMHGTNTGWGTPQLAAWLRESYAPATMGYRPEMAQARTVVASRHPLGAVTTEAILLEARERVLDIVRTCASSVSEVSQLYAAQYVQAARDRLLGMGYVPVAASEMRLVDRVGSLFIADFMSRPNDYKEHIRICDACGEVSFEWAESHLDAGGAGCGARMSGVIRRRSDAIHPKSLDAGAGIVAPAVGGSSG